MSKRMSIEEMSAEELYELARQREQQEYEQQMESRKAELEALREERRQLIAEHKKALVAIDKKIKAMGGRAPRKSAGTAAGTSTGGGRRGGEQSKAILELISAQGPITTADLKAQLEAQGFDTKHLSQQLAYLKRRGQVSNPSRAVYAVA